MVFENVKKPYVLKLTMAKDPAYMEYVRLINTHPNKYFPKISDMKILEVNGEKFGVYLIERLQTMKKPWNQIYAEILRRIMGVHDEEEGILTLRNTPAPHRLDVPQYQWEEILDQIDGNEELITAIKLVASWVNKRINRIDMHSGNIMQRSDGTVVITDPYAPLSTDLRYEAENEYQQGKEFYNTDSNYLKSSGDW